MLQLTECVTQLSICLSSMHLLSSHRGYGQTLIRWTTKSGVYHRDESTMPRSTVSTTSSLSCRRVASLRPQNHRAKLFDIGVFHCMHVFVKTMVTLSTHIAVVWIAFLYWNLQFYGYRYVNVWTVASLGLVSPMGSNWRCHLYLCSF